MPRLVCKAWGCVWRKECISFLLYNYEVGGSNPMDCKKIMKFLVYTFNFFHHDTTVSLS